MRIRPSRPTDRPALLAAVEALAAHLAELDPHARLRREPGYAERYVAHRSRTGWFALVAEDDGALIGVLLGRVEDPVDLPGVRPERIGVVDDLWVQPERRGAGVGKALLAAVEEHFRTRGCSWATLDDLASNEPSRAIYRHLGWEERLVRYGKRLGTTVSERERLAELDRLLAAGLIDDPTWYREVAAITGSAYLRGGNPRAESGHSGDEAHWRQAREIVVDALDRDGSFLDIGCATGHLLECVVNWAAERGRAIEPHGLDIVPELVERARARLPAWADRLHVGNAWSWTPPMRYDFVRIGLEYVPPARRQAWVARLLDQVVAPGGRLIVGVANEPADAPSEIEAQLRSWGHPVAGSAQRPHRFDPRLVYRVVWIAR